ncbi:MAPK regulated corepressor interacting protein 2 isoform X2 [Suncus etruscus]|uniref:MAPK regulated corepressor interacting protein 2 isoform X2 n=1 Tax=Suncus etruscus TaxID=109475 RepID=UPI00210FFEC9|nr:MAPK regulated corepressor interacting protein 2 isoform X2 [Suncus etruscus]
MYTITKGPSKLVAQRRTGASQQQVDCRLGELKCRQPAPPSAPPPRPPPGPWPLSSAPLSGGRRSGAGAPEPRKASRPAGSRLPGGAAQDSRLPAAFRAKACVQPGEWPAAPRNIPIPGGTPGAIHAGP